MHESGRGDITKCSKSNLPQSYDANVITLLWCFKTSLEVLRKYAILYIKEATKTLQVLGKIMKKQNCYLNIIMQNIWRVEVKVIAGIR